MLKTFNTLLQMVRRRLELHYFMRNGMKPWTRGYEQYRWNTINNVLDSGLFNERIGSERFGYRVDERVVEYPWFFSRLPHGGGRILDAGSALNHHYLVQQPSLKEKKLYIATLAPEGSCFWNMGISYLFEDLRDSVFKSESFQYIACISTLEHIGLDNTLLYTGETSKNESRPKDFVATIRTLCRLLLPGGCMYVTFPFGLHVNHGWFQVFDSLMVDEVIDAFGPKEVNETIFQYADDRWSVSSRESAKEATCFDIHFQKEYDPDFAAFSRAVACLELKR